MRWQRYNVFTFLRDGFPGGLAPENRIPVAHVLKKIDCGAFVANCLTEEPEFTTAHCCFASAFASEETNEVE